jgi:hypothetical protein
MGLHSEEQFSPLHHHTGQACCWTCGDLLTLLRTLGKRLCFLSLSFPICKMRAVIPFIQVDTWMLWK